MKADEIVLILLKMDHVHYKFHKPFNCLSQFIYEGKRKGSKHLIGEYYDFAEGTMAIGRLDENSEGLLLLTTDGKVSAAVRSAKYEKEYYVQVQGEISEEAIQKIALGVEIGFNGIKYRTKPCKAWQIEKPTHLPMEDRKVKNEDHGSCSWLAIVIKEGKFRQVRKMTAAVGFPTLRLVRYRIGTFTLNLPVRGVEQIEIKL
jgi:23S rRNA pseudouridine2457 synthase